MERPVKCVTVEKARELQNEWKQSRGREIMRAQKYEDTREFWYSVEELEQYLKYVKEKSATQGIENPGIRIYFGAYPANGKERSYSTIFLSPTLGSLKTLEEAEEDGGENNYEIEPLNSSTGGYPPKEY